MCLVATIDGDSYAGVLRDEELRGSITILVASGKYVIIDRNNMLEFIVHENVVPHPNAFLI